MKLNRKWLMVIALVMSLTMATAGTLAYLTDRDSEANVFTVGNVEIDLKEDFKQGATLIPGVNIQKKPVITNTGKNDAWVWAEIAIPSELNSTATASKNVIHFNMTADSVENGKWNWWDGADYSEGAYMIRKEKINGVDYDVYVVQYGTALEPGETTVDLIHNVYLDTHVDIDPDGNWAWVEDGVVTSINWNSEDDGNPIIYVSAYAMQKEQFDTVYKAYEAYRAQWGTNGTEWGDLNGDEGGETPEATEIAGTEELVSALAEGGYYKLTNDITVTEKNMTVNADTVITAEEGVKLTFNGNTVIEGEGTLTFKNVDTSCKKEIHVNGNVIFDGGDHEWALLAVQDDAVVTIKDGNFKFTAFENGHTWTPDIILAQRGTLNVEGGTITLDGHGDYSIHLGGFSKQPENVTVNISGGTIYSGKEDLFYTEKAENNSTNTHVAITGGTFHLNSGKVLTDHNTWDVPGEYADGIASITGGTFYTSRSDRVAAYVANGYELTGDETNGYVVSAK